MQAVVLALGSPTPKDGEYLLGSQPRSEHVTLGGHVSRIDYRLWGAECRLQIGC